MTWRLVIRPTALTDIFAVIHATRQNREWKRRL
jgi:hypothetical protein